MADTIMHCRGITKGAANVEGATYLRIAAATTRVTDPGDAAHPGTEAELVSKRDIRVTIGGKDPNVLLALVESAAADVVGLFKESAGTNRKVTVKNVAITEPLGEIEVPDPDGGGKVRMYAVRGVALFGAADTLATMITFAADS